MLPVLSATADECISMLQEAGVAVLTTAVREAVGLDQTNLAGPVALLIGNEGSGVLGCSGCKG